MIAPFAGSIASLERAWRRLQVTVLVGADDMYRADVERLVQYLKDREHHVALETIAGLAHAYPSDFAERLPSLLKP
jgi:acetyl esterase/lipase